MKRFRAVAFGVLVFWHIPVFGFSLLGPYEAWMQVTNSFRLGPDIGGPMNLGAGYRWNVPVVTYAFAPSFVDVFGSNGIAAVESAIGVLNSLDPASQMVLSNFPTATGRINFRAESENLVDLKSTTLFLLLQQLGLTQPTRYAFCIHDFVVTNYQIAATVVQRNFDPSSLAPSAFVNGVQYFYSLQFSFDKSGQANAVAIDYPGSPYDPAFTTVADANGTGTLSPGSFYSGLSGDDAGGIRYLLQTNHYAYEPLLPDVHGAGTNANSYVNTALRAGVDKITFVRQDYDPLLGRAYVSLTNQFTDTYLTNNTLVRQRLERVVSRPDFIFSAYDDSTPTPVGWGYQCTGTSNWLNNSSINPSLNSSGPGTIRPQVSIAFRDFGLTDNLWTGDVPPFTSPGETQLRWGWFDGSSNAPVVFPSTNGQAQVTTLRLVLTLSGANLTAPQSTSLLLSAPVPFAGQAALQTSTNLTSWSTVTTVANSGMTVFWTHVCSPPERFFRVLPQ